MKRIPAWLRLVIALVVAPIAPLLLFAWLIEPPTLRDFRDYVIVIALALYPATVLIGVPLWYMARRRHWRWGITAVIVGGLTLAPWAILALASDRLPHSSEDGHGVIDILSAYWATGELPLMIVQCNMLGILSGAIFHMIALGRPSKRWR